MAEAQPERHRIDLLSRCLFSRSPQLAVVAVTKASYKALERSRVKVLCKVCVRAI